MRGKNHLRGWRGWSALVLISIASSARGHDPGLSTAALKILPDHLEAEATFARADIEALVPLDANHDGRVTSDELESAGAELEVLSHKVFNVSSIDALVNVDPRFRLDENDNFHMSGIFRAQGAELTVASPLIKQLPRGHRQFIRVLDNQGATLAEALLTAEHNTIDVGRGSAEKGQPATISTFGEFFFMGVEHILTGYDHLIFLFGLLIAMSQFRATVWVITCFTLAHSATLALAAFNVVRVPDRIVEPLIAATIIYVGAENLLRPDNVAGRWRLTLVFGLVHGLGFATHLKEKFAGIIGEKIVVPLASFNLGVELGQMAVAALIFPLIWWLRRAPALVRRLVPACSVLVVLAGTWWLVQRTLLE
jgi:hydrogenase/urease accessory protein HupE